MFIRKAIAGISALLITSSMPCFAVIAAETDDTAQGNGYRQEPMNAVVYTDDNIQTVASRYYDEMPNVPYISFADYYQLWTNQKAEVTRNQDGTYDIRVPYGTKGTVNIETDILTAEDTASFIYPEIMLSDDDPYNHLFARTVQDAASDEKVPVEIDFSAYQIDIRGDETDLWFPVTTLCDFFTAGTNQAFYLFDTLFFRSAMLREDSILMALTPDYVSFYLEKYKDGRPKDLADYNYNELCLTFDRVYGLPGRAPFTELIREKGFDGFLSEGSSTTQYIRELLHSSDIVEYTTGLDMLNMYLSDGGHTNFNATAEMDEGILNQVIDAFGSIEPDPTGIMNPAVLENSVSMSVKAIQDARTALYASADYVEQMNTSVYCEKGDTAIFSFDSFLTDLDSWLAYYTQDGEMPQDMVSEFYTSLKKAAENPKIKRFVLDVSLNTGGYTMIAQYMMGVLANADRAYNISNCSDDTLETRYLIDKNLDRQINELDDNLQFDLQYAVLASQRSFSSGNLLPSLAHDNGVLLLGETSGGGSCSVEYYLTADGMCYSLSAGTCMADRNYVSIDGGVQPDYVLYEQHEDGTKDFSAAYDIGTLDKCFEEFYSAFLCGDVNLDNEISVADAQSALIAYTEQVAGNADKLTVRQRKAADVTGDGRFSIEDVQLILRYYTERNVSGNNITWDDLTGSKPKDAAAQK